ncbi:MAG: autotransporter outer membrane beta-barrel domain-containing protein [Thermoflexaceae bacterium]|nr:autotransporter outer membrane beta-barrel domain-containing protein [Thermoflexaceae bacterium]
MKKFQALTLAGGAVQRDWHLRRHLVQAQSAPATQTPTTQAAPRAPTAPPTAHAEVNAYMTKLAASLGISVDSLNAAVQKANLATIDELQANGTISAERATEMRTRAGEAGAGFMLGGGKGGPGGDHRGGRGGVMNSADLATFLGVTEDTLRTELSTQSLRDRGAEPRQVAGPAEGVPFGRAEDAPR